MLSPYPYYLLDHIIFGKQNILQGKITTGIDMALLKKKKKYNFCDAKLMNSTVKSQLLVLIQGILKISRNLVLLGKKT